MKTKSYLKRLGTFLFAMFSFCVAQVSAQEELTVVVNPIGNNDAIISWNEISGVTNYNVQLCVGAVPFCKNKNLNTEETGEFSVCAQTVWGDELDPLTTYEYTVTPVGSSVSPVTGFFTTTAKISVISHSDAFISWSEISDATSYTVKICEDSDCKTVNMPIGKFSVCAQSVWGGALNPQTTYSYTVTPVNSSASPVVSGNFTTTAMPTMVSHSDAIISWNKIGSATSYTVEICDASSNCRNWNTTTSQRFVSAQTVWGGALNPETDYTYTVTPLDDSTSSPVISGNFTTGTTPPPVIVPGDPGTPPIPCPVLDRLWIKSNEAEINGNNVTIKIDPKAPGFGSLSAVEVYATTTNNDAPNTKVAVNGINIDLTKNCPDPTLSLVDFRGIMPPPNGTGPRPLTIKVSADKCGPGRPSTPESSYIPSGKLSIGSLGGNLRGSSLCSGGGGGTGDDCAYEGYTCSYEDESTFDPEFDIPTGFDNPNADNKQLQDCFNVTGVKVDCSKQVKGVVIKRYTDGSVEKELK